MGEAKNYVHDLNTIILLHNIEHEYEFDKKPNLASGSKTLSTCKLHIKLPGAEVTDYAFEAIASNKKQSKQIAAGKALSKIKELNLFKIDDNSLLSAVKKELSPKGLLVDPVFHTYLHLIHEKLNGWIPIGLIASSRKVKSWYTNNCSGKTMQEFARDFFDHLKNGEEIFEIDKEKHLLYPKEKIELNKESLEEIKNKSGDIEKAKGVYIPNDLNEEIKEIEITSEMAILEQVSKILQEPMTSILHWTNVGRKIPSLESLPNENGEVKIIKEITKEPTMWSTFENLNCINDRASWISGCQIYGPVFLTICRPVPEDSRKKNVKWRDYDINDFYRSCSYLFPESQLMKKVITSPFLQRMPQKLNSLISWKGNLPSILFYDLFKIINLKEKPIYICKDDTWSCTWHLKYYDKIEIEIETEYYIDKKLALEKCYFIALQELSQAFKTQIFKIVEKSNNQIKNFKIIKNGYETKPVVSDSHYVKLNYIASVKTREDRWEKIEEQHNQIIEIGTGSVIKELEEALKGQRINTAFEFECEASLPGLDILNQFEKMLTKVEVQVIGISSSKLSMIKVFEPVLSIQRYNAILKILSENEISKILDLGCGGGKMLQYILKENLNLNKIKRMYGVDISEKALELASVKLYEIMKESNSVSLNRVENEVFIEILQGNIIEDSQKWHKFNSIDAVIMIEVIEHLDPEPLNKVGKIILGNIRPKLFIVTTPNWEYNKLLYHIAGIPNIKVLGRDETPLRCSDHRFEWTRKEFENWCHKLSLKYGYKVKYEGIGMAINEKEARKELNIENIDIGLSTQMAIFKKDLDLNFDCLNIIESSDVNCENKLNSIWSSEQDLINRNEINKEDELSILDDESHF